MQYTAIAQLRDLCDAPIKYRNIPTACFVDIDEYVVPYAELKCAKPGAPFPFWIVGEFYVGAQNVWTFVMYINQSDSVHAVYRADSWHIWQWLWGDTLSGTKELKFSVPYSHDASYNVCVGQVEFCVDDVIFQDTLSIDGYYPDYTACFPDSDYMRFGASVSIDIGYQNWPADCEQFWCTIDAYKGDTLLVSTKCDSIVPDHFNTRFYDAEYMIHGFQEVNIPIDWLGKIYGYAPGPRPVGPFDPRITLRIFHAFRADNILFQAPPPDTIYPGDTLMTIANPYPMLSENRRIKYLWYMTQTGVGRYQFGTDFPSIWPNNPFIAENPGACQLYYIVEDTASSTHYADTSAYLPIQVMGPTIVITAPADSDKVTFDSSAIGVLNITATGTLNPLSDYQDSLIWSITPIVGSNLSISPPSAKGQTVTFTFEHLPADNNEFGNKYIKAELPNWNLAESVLVKVFYPADAYNNPSDTLPNWYYYWKQTPANLDTNQYGGLSCDDTTYGYFRHWKYSAGETLFHVCYKASMINVSPGYLSHSSGIDCFGEVCLHEHNHFTNWWAWWGGHQYDSLYADPDSDFIPSALEPLFGLDSLSWDSDHDEIYDFEKIAYDAMRNWIVHSVDSLDWSKPGHQY